MTVEEARAVLDKNADCLPGSIIYELYESSCFPEEQFWEFYECVIVLTEDAFESGGDFETARLITYVYEWLLREVFFRFDKNDRLEDGDLPEECESYIVKNDIERLDDAVDAYCRVVFVDEKLYELQHDQ